MRAEEENLGYTDTTDLTDTGESHLYIVFVKFVTQTSPCILCLCHMTKGEQKSQVSTLTNLLKKAAAISKQPKFRIESQEHSGL